MLYYYFVYHLFIITHITYPYLRLRQEADIRRTTLEEEHLSLGTRRVVASQNLTAAQNAHDTLARQLADNETYVQLNNMEKKVCIENEIPKIVTINYRNLKRLFHLSILINDIIHFLIFSKSVEPFGTK